MRYGLRSPTSHCLLTRKGALRSPGNHAVPVREHLQKDGFLVRVTKGWLTVWSELLFHCLHLTEDCFLVSKPASILPDLSRVALNQREINGYIQLPFIFGPTVFSP